MVDWNLDGAAVAQTTKPSNLAEFYRHGIPSDGRTVRKAKPLVHKNQQYMTHSGRKHQHTPSIRIKKAKRDGFGDVVRR